MCPCLRDRTWPLRPAAPILCSPFCSHPFPRQLGLNLVLNFVFIIPCIVVKMYLCKWVSIKNKWFVLYAFELHTHNIKCSCSSVTFFNQYSVSEFHLYSVWCKNPPYRYNHTFIYTFSWQQTFKHFPDVLLLRKERRALCFPTPSRIKVQEIFCKIYIKILYIYTQRYVMFSDLIFSFNNVFWTSFKDKYMTTQWI